MWHGIYFVVYDCCRNYTAICQNVQTYISVHCTRAHTRFYDDDDEDDDANVVCAPMEKQFSYTIWMKVDF